MTVKKALLIAEMYFSADTDGIFIRNGDGMIEDVSYDTPVYPGDVIERAERFF